MKIELKGVKGFEGPDSYCFTASLYLDGKKRCEVGDDGNGGCLRFSDWKVAKELNEYGATLPELPLWEDGTGSFQQDAESLVSDALDEFLETKRLKALCRTKTVFRLPDTPKGEALVMKNKYDARVKAHLLNKYGDSVVILNETYG